MPSRDKPPSRQPQFGDPDYDFVAFKRDMFGGRLRWLATILALASGVLVICGSTGLLPAEMYWPIHVQGFAAKALVIAAFIFWSVVAAVNWRTHAKSHLGG